MSAVFAQTDHELWLLTVRHGDQLGGLIATCVAQASIVPDQQRVLVGVGQHHRTCELLQAAGTFALHLLAEAQLAWVWRFGLHSGRDVNKFAGLDWVPSALGNPLLTGAAAWLDCRTAAAWDAGDRTFFLGDVQTESLVSPGPMLTLKRLLALATPEQLQQMKECRLHDAATEAALLTRWRNARGV